MRELQVTSRIFQEMSTELVTLHSTKWAELLDMTLAQSSAWLARELLLLSALGDGIIIGLDKVVTCGWNHFYKVKAGWRKQSVSWAMAKWAWLCFRRAQQFRDPPSETLFHIRPDLALQMSSPRRILWGKEEMLSWMLINNRTTGSVFPLRRWPPWGPTHCLIFSLLSGFGRNDPESGGMQIMPCRRLSWRMAGTWCLVKSNKCSEQLEHP